MMSLLSKIFLGFSGRPIAPGKMANLHNYKYSGVDKSLLSRAVLNAYWSWLVGLFPEWMAPNMITLTGLLAIASCTVLILWNSPTLASELPRWLYLYTAFCMFAYQSLDAIDGKQARRTGTSGPLGELFDHGCDALNLVLMGLISPALFRLKPDLLAVSLMCLAFAAFYVASWEEYYTGTLYLGYFSGPVEGTLLVVTLCIVAGLLGGSFWLREFDLPWVGTVQYNSALVYPTIVCTVLTIATSMYNVFKLRGLFPATRLLPFAGFSLTSFLLYRHYPVLTTYPNFILYFLLCGAAFAFAVARLITSHVSKENFPFWTPGYIPFILLALGTLSDKLGIYFNSHPLAATWFLCVSLVFALLVYTRLVLATINQICEFLDIYCLRIKHPRQD